MCAKLAYNNSLSWIAGKTIIISNQPFFYKKAELFPGSTFVIGADTAVRLVNVSASNELEILYFLNAKKMCSSSLECLGIF